MRWTKGHGDHVACDLEADAGIKAALHHVDVFGDDLDR